MTDPPIIWHKRFERTILLSWAIAATLAALFFWSQSRQRSTSSPAPGKAPASPFLDLAESAIPGRYKWISNPGSESFITLNEDHSFINKGGTLNPGHRWELTRDSLVIFWLRSQSRFNKIERPGVYVEIKDGTEVARMEKQE